MEKKWTEEELQSLSAERVKAIAKSYNIKPSFKIKNIEAILKAQSKGKKEQKKEVIKKVPKSNIEEKEETYIDIPLNVYQITDFEDHIKHTGTVDQLKSALSWAGQKSVSLKEENVIGLREDKYDITTVPDYLIYIYRDEDELKYVSEGQTHIDEEHKATHFYRLPREMILKKLSVEEYTPDMEEKFNEKMEAIYNFPFTEKRKL
jgi:hypothetical protein